MSELRRCGKTEPHDPHGWLTSSYPPVGQLGEDVRCPGVSVKQDGTKQDGADMINHPPHYTAHPSGVECITITEHMGFNLGNAFKYIWRADLKGDVIEDLRKARWYVDREIARRERRDG